MDVIKGQVIYYFCLVDIISFKGNCQFLLCLSEYKNLPPLFLPEQIYSLHFFLFSMHVYVWELSCLSTCLEVIGQLTGICYFFPLCGTEDETQVIRLRSNAVIQWAILLTFTLTFNAPLGKVHLVTFQDLLYPHMDHLIKCLWFCKADGGIWGD